MKFGFHKTLVAALLLAAPTAGMGSDVSFAYQGLLLDEVGNQLSEPNHSIVFRIYDQPAGGLPLWSCTRNVLLDGKGQFSVEISGNAPSGESLSSVFAAHASSALYIGLTVDNDEGEIAPRQKLMSVPKAVWATDSVAAKNDMAVAGSLHGAAASLQSVQQARSLVASNRLECGSLQVGSLSNTNLVVNGSINGSMTGNGKGTIPLRGIIVWSGSQASIPPEWALCDGNEYNNIKTPNLLSRFIVGAGTGSGYKVGDKNKINESVSVVLTAKQMPAHSHDFKFTGAGLVLDTNSDPKFFFCGDSAPRDSKTITESTENAGSGKAYEKRPPFYALCYIMRVK